MSRSIADQMEITHLESQLASARTTVSRAINFLEQVKIALQEDDIDEAMRLINEATGAES